MNTVARPFRRLRPGGSRPILFALSLALAAATGQAQLGPAGDRLVTAADLPGLTLTLQSSLGDALATGDFDGDGRDDLAIGISRNDVGGVNQAGQVVVLYSVASAGALAAQIFDQNTPGIGDAAEPGDRFGDALASGDFNGDGWDDLAIGASRETIGGATSAGLVHALYGNPAGLLAGPQTFTAAVAAGVIQPNAGFGRALAAGDFDGDGWDDLAIGAPRESVDGISEAGAVVVIYGAPGALNGGTAERWTQAQLGVDNGLDDAEVEDRFGSTLAVGDFDGNSHDDLAIGAPREDEGALQDVGALNVMYGNAGGLGAAGNQFLLAQPAWRNQDDLFADALAAGDFDGDGSDDLAVGIADFDLGAIDTGLVYLMFSELGLGVDPSTFIVRDQEDAGEIAEEGDGAGSSLAVGDFDCDGYDDLVFAAQGELVSDAEEAGAISVLPGDPDREMTHGSSWHQDSPGLVDVAEDVDVFGGVLAVGRFGGACDDLAVGVPGEDHFDGAVHLIFNGVPLFADGFESGDFSAWSSVQP